MIESEAVHCTPAYAPGILGTGLEAAAGGLLGFSGKGTPVETGRPGSGGGPNRLVVPEGGPTAGIGGGFENLFEAALGGAGFGLMTGKR